MIEAKCIDHGTILLLLAAEGETVAQTRPTILQIIPRLDMGGAERSVVEIAAAVGRAGGRALVLAEPGRLAPEVIAAGGEILPIWPSWIAALLAGFLAYLGFTAGRK